MNELKKQAIEKIRTHLRAKDFEEIAKMPLREGENKHYSLRTIQSVAYGLRENEQIFKLLLDKVEEKLAKIREKVNKIEQLSNGN